MKESIAATHRRSVLRSLLLVPGAVAIPAALPAPAPAATKPALNETPLTPTVNADSFADGFVRTFTQEQFAALKKLDEIIVPSSEDTPGAEQAKAAEFLDFLIGQSPADRMQLYRTGLDSRNSQAHRLYEKPFASVTVSEAEPILAPLRQPWSYAPTTGRFLQTAKADLLQATLNSREYIAVVSRRRRDAGASGKARRNGCDRLSAKSSRGFPNARKTSWVPEPLKHSPASSR